MNADGTDILLVEDDESLRASMSDFLEQNGHPVLCAGSIGEALDALQTARPALCVLDVNLPDGSGLDLLRRIAAQRMNTRVVVMTAFPLQHLRTLYSSRTLVGWLTKPIAPQELLGIIEAARRPRDTLGH